MATNTKATWTSTGELLIGNVASAPAPAYSIRKRVAIADINAGATILPAVPGVAYRMLNCSMVAYGGAVGTVTTIDILGTQGGSGVKLVAYGQASLAQSAELRAGDTGGTVLADGASYAVCDADTAITIGKTGGDADTATGVDVILEFAMEM